MSRHGFLVGSAAVILLTPVAAAAAPSGSEQRPAPAAVHGDRDGDRVDDAFQGRLRSAGSEQRFDVIVTGLSAAASKRAVGGFEVRRSLPLVDGFSATMTAGQARALARQPGVRRVEQVTRMQALDEGTNRDFGASAVPIDHPGVDGSGVGLCVVDTGADPAHEQLAPRPVRFFDVVNGRTAAYDDHGHGTHVLSIAAGDGVGGASAGTFSGVAPAAELYAVKVLDSTGYGDSDQVVSGIQWCASQPGVSVISLSLGDPVGGDGTDAPSVAVNTASAGGDVVVVAAGNSGDLPETINAPGTASEAVTVGAVSEHSNPVGTDRHDNGVWLAAFSSRGPTSDKRTKPDVVAPGVSVTAAAAGSVGGYVTHSGTSMAAPYVAGAFVLAREAAPQATVSQLRSALAATAVDVGASGADNEYGAGLVDVRALVDQVAGVSPLRTTSFPAQSRVTGTVPDGGTLDFPITVPPDGVGTPLAVTMTIAGRPVCYFGCLYVEWDPDLDMELRSPDGTTLAVSECALGGLSCASGRQETIGIRPAVSGTYVLHVYTWQGGSGAPVAVDVSRGPAGAAAPAPNVAPTADAGPDRTVRAKGKGQLGTFTLDGSGSSDSDGTVVSYLWQEGATVVASSATVTLKRPVGTYTFTLTVTDDDGATGSDTTTVVVRR